MRHLRVAALGTLMGLSFWLGRTFAAKSGPDAMSRLPALIRENPRVPDPGAIAADAIEYYQYRALAERNPSACAALSALQTAMEPIFKTDHHWASSCRMRAEDLLLIRDIITGNPEAYRSCLETRRIIYRPPARRPADFMSWPDVEKFCRATVELSDMAVACPRDARPYRDPRMREKCVIMMRALSGDGEGCARVEDPADALECAGEAAFANAFKAKDAGLCGASDVCRAMMGDAAGIADRYARGIIARF